MIGRSRKVYTNQSGPHARLTEVVTRHRARPWRKPVRDRNRRAFADLAQNGPQSRLILDSGCGTGVSTLELARRFPDCRVVGVDKSAHRLARTPDGLPPNALLVRMELEDFWRLAQAAGWKPDQHWILYPNPWPKAAHLKRRWHGHPVFPHLLALGGRLVVRSNWRIYLEEFSRALVLAGHAGGVIMPVEQIGDASPFERKYRASGQPVFELIADLEARP